MTNLNITRKERKSAVVAMLLGDGCLWKHPTSSKYCLSITHSNKQLELIEYKRDILQLMFHYPLNIYHGKVFLKENNKSYNTLVIRTRGHRIFNVLRKVAYNFGKRNVTRGLLDKLTPLGLAIWYMDDGNHNEVKTPKGTIRQRSMRLAVCSYSPEEVEIIREYFREVWGITWQVNYRKGKNPVLRIGAKEGAKFCEIISPFVLPSMKYKLLREYQVKESGAS